MSKKPNAANITHGLAQLGGGSKEEGGGGMMQGIQNIFVAGYEYAQQHALANGNSLEEIDVSNVLQIDNNKSDS